MVLAEFSEEYHLVEKAEAIYAFLVPFFPFSAFASRSEAATRVAPATSSMSWA